MAQEPYLVLARKWRPQNFGDVAGQEHITRTLQNAITAGRIGHAFLFIGSRGIGKTTTARILAKALNCEAASGPTPDPCGACENCRSIAAGNNIDVLEIDGASNNSVDNVRDIRDNIRLSPARSRYKIYIIDEVHQLSGGAFNALLKTLEEPPEHAIFILATTEARKIPATIVSRCQRYDFRRVSIDGVTALLRHIADQEGVACSAEALQAIARASDGGVRDAQSILEQVISFCDGEVAFKDVQQVLGLIDWQVLDALAGAILEKDAGKLLDLVEEMTSAGKDLSQFLQDILEYFRNLLVCKTAGAERLLALPPDEIAVLEARAASFTLTGLIRIIEQFADLARDFDARLAQRIALETLLIRMCKAAVEVSADTVLEKLLTLEAQGLPQGGGAPVRGEASAAPPSGPTPGEEPEPGPDAAGAADVGEASPPRAKRTAQRGKKTAPKSGESDAEEADRETSQAAGLTATEANMAAVWDQVMERLQQTHMRLGIWLGGAVPLRIEGDALVVGGAARNGGARKALDDPENRRILEQVLTEITGNIRRFVYERRESSSEQGPSAARAAPASWPVSGKVDPGAARKALENPHVAQVLEVFKGRIVDIKNQA